MSYRPDKPLPKNERKALQFMAENSPCKRPSGLGLNMTQNFKQRGWMEYQGRNVDFGPEIYAITDAGRKVLESN